MRRLGPLAALAFACTVSASPGPAPQSDEPVAPTPAPQRAVRDAFEALYEVRDLRPFADGRFRARGLTAWIPRHGRGPCRVLIVLDGQGASSWFALDRAVVTVAALRSDRWVIVPIVSTSERTRELRRADGAFANFVVEHVWATLRGEVELAEGPVHAVLGYSYGGLGALAFALERPDVFGHAIAMSASIWYGDRAILTSISRAPRLPTRVWLDIGMSETGRRPTHLPLMVADARVVRDALLDRGLRFGERLGYFEAPGESHDMAAGGRRIDQALEFALGGAASTPRSLTVRRYPPLRGQTAYSVELTREDGSRWTVPPRLFEARAGTSRVRRTLVSASASLAVEAFGLSAEAP